MNNSKVILFGSFTEDEIRSLQNKPSENTKVPVQKTEFQFGSLPPVVGEVLIGPGCETGKLLVSSAKPANSVKKNDSLLDKKDTLKGPERVSKENGTIVGPRNSSVQSDGVQDDRTSTPNLSSLSLLDNNVAVLSQASFSSPVAGQDARSQVVYSNGVHDETQVVVPAKYGGNKASNGGITVARDLLPRGLINAGNLCFLNATLQALLSCSPFVKLLQELRNRDIPKVGYPTVNAFMDFLSEFDFPSDTSSKKKDPTAIETGRPFSPAMFEDVVKNFTPDVPSGFSGRTRQEDAQEFLSFVMDRLHDELLKLGGQVPSMGPKKSSSVSSSEDDEWETVGPKNKSAVTRTQSYVPSELSAIFGGQLMSVVKAKGNKASATIQRYLLLHLDIFSEAVRTIEDALRLFSAPETLEGYRASNTGKVGVVSASKSVKIKTLSKIMILHLMRFSYGSQGSTKLHKPIRFPLEFVLGRDLLVSPMNEGRKYELVATITHHGKDPSKGHYTADARHTNGQWLRFDDASVVAIPTSKVLHDQAYVLFYKQA